MIYLYYQKLTCVIQDGKSWKEIQDVWFTMTGNRYTNLSTRYTRVRASIARVKDEDLEVLEKAMGKAKERIEEEKRAVEKRLWTFVAEGMVSAGSERYDAPILEKAWKRLQNDHAAAAKSPIS